MAALERMMAGGAGISNVSDIVAMHGKAGEGVAPDSRLARARFTRAIQQKFGDKVSVDDAYATVRGATAMRGLHDEKLQSDLAAGINGPIYGKYQDAGKQMALSAASRGDTFAAKGDAIQNLEKKLSASSLSTDLKEEVLKGMAAGAVEAEKAYKEERAKQGEAQKLQQEYQTKLWNITVPKVFEDEVTKPMFDTMMSGEIAKIAANGGAGMKTFVDSLASTGRLGGGAQMALNSAGYGNLVPKNTDEFEISIKKKTQTVESDVKPGG